MRDGIKGKRSRTLRKGMLFHQANASYFLLMAAIHQGGIQLVDYPRHSPDILPNDYKRSGKLRKGILFHQANASSILLMAAIHQTGIQLVEHPRHSPDILPSDYIQFPKLKDYLCGRKFASDNGELLLRGSSNVERSLLGQMH